MKFKRYHLILLTLFVVIGAIIGYTEWNKFTNKQDNTTQEAKQEGVTNPSTKATNEKKPPSEPPINSDQNPTTEQPSEGATQGTSTNELKPTTPSEAVLLKNDILQSASENEYFADNLDEESFSAE